MRSTLRVPALALALLAAESPSVSATQAPQVALAPFVVLNDSGATIRQAADSCLAVLTAGLKARGIRVVQLASLDRKTLGRAGPTPWAVLGEFKREKSMVQGELRLMAVASGEEMRSYFNSGGDTRILVPLSAKAAERIALFVKETPVPTGP